MKKIKIMHKIIFCYIILFCLSSCDVSEPHRQETYHKQETKKYNVQLSNWVGTDSYDCDSVIWINEHHIKLKNKEDKESFMDILTPSTGVVIKISLNK
jgi:uncharacterized lipoprotein YehR (DUF1307 family)